jgi:hypothetical protein
MKISLYCRQSNLLMLLLTISLVLIFQCTSNFYLKGFAQGTTLTPENKPPVEPPEFQGLSAAEKAASTNESCSVTILSYFFKNHLAKGQPPYGRDSSGLGL